MYLKMISIALLLIGAFSQPFEIYAQDAAAMNRFQELDYNIKQWVDIQRENPKATAPEGLAEDIVERAKLAKELSLEDVKTSMSDSMSAITAGTAEGFGGLANRISEMSDLLSARAEQLNEQKEFLETWRRRYGRDAAAAIGIGESAKLDDEHRKQLEDIQNDVGLRLKVVADEMTDLKRRQSALDAASKTLSGALAAAGVAQDVRDGKFVDASGKVIDFGKLFADKEGKNRLNTASGGLEAANKLVSGDVLGAADGVISILDEKLPDYGPSIAREAELVDTLRRSKYFSESMSEKAKVLQGKAQANLKKMLKAQANRDALDNIKKKLGAVKKIVDYVNAAQNLIAVMNGTYVETGPGTSKTTARMLGGLKATGELLKNLADKLPPGLKESIGVFLNFYAEALISGPDIYERIRSANAEKDCDNRYRWSSSHARDQLTDAFPLICLAPTEEFKETASLYVNTDRGSTDPRYFFVPDMDEDVRIIAPGDYARLVSIASAYSAYATILQESFIMDDPTVEAILAAIQNGSKTFTINDGYFFDTTFVIADLVSDAAILLQVRSAIKDALTPENAQEMIAAWKDFMTSVQITERRCDLTLVQSPRRRYALFEIYVRDMASFNDAMERQSLFAEDSNQYCKASLRIDGPESGDTGAPLAFSAIFKPQSALLDEVAKSASVAWTADGVKFGSGAEAQYIPEKAETVTIKAAAVMQTPLGERRYASERVVDIAASQKPSLAIQGPRRAESGEIVRLKAKAFGVPEDAEKDIAWTRDGDVVGAGDAIAFSIKEPGDYETVAALKIDGEAVVARHRLTVTAKAKEEEPAEKAEPETGKEKTEAEAGGDVPSDGASTEESSAKNASEKEGVADWIKFVKGLINQSQPKEQPGEQAATGTKRQTPGTNGQEQGKAGGASGGRQGSQTKSGQQDEKSTSATTQPAKENGTAKTTSTKSEGVEKDPTTSSTTSQQNAGQTIPGAPVSDKMGKDASGASTQKTTTNYCEQLRAVPKYLTEVKLAYKKANHQLYEICYMRQQERWWNNERYNPAQRNGDQIDCEDECLTKDVEADYQKILNEIISQSSEANTLVSNWDAARNAEARQRALSACESRLRKPAQYYQHYPEGEKVTLQDACGNKGPAIRTAASAVEPALTGEPAQTSKATITLGSSSSVGGSLPLGSVISLQAKILIDGKPAGKDVVVRWEPMAGAGVSFKYPEGPGRATNSATLLKPGPATIWVVALGKDGDSLVTLGESNQIVVDVKPPALALTASPSSPMIGEETTLALKETPALPDDAFSMRWDIKGPAISPGETSKKRGYSFIPKSAESVTVTADVWSLPGSEDLGQASVTITPRPYAVKVNVELPPEAVKPFQNVTMGAEISPAPSGDASDLRYAWTFSEGCFSSHTIARETRVQRSEAGTCQGRVEIKDKRGAALGAGEGSFTVSADPSSGGDKNPKQALDNAAKKWAEGDEEGACDEAQQALSIAPKNKNAVAAVGKYCEQGRDVIRNAVEKASEAIGAQDFKQARELVEKAKSVNASSGTVKKAEAELEKAEKAAKSDKSGDDALKQIVEGASLCKQQKWKECEETLAQAISAVDPGLKKRESKIFAKAEAMRAMAAKKIVEQQNNQQTTMKRIADAAAQCKAGHWKECEQGLGKALEQADPEIKTRNPKVMKKAEAMREMAAKKLAAQQKNQQSVLRKIADAAALCKSGHWKECEQGLGKALEQADPDMKKQNPKIMKKAEAMREMAAKKLEQLKQFNERKAAEKLAQEKIRREREEQIAAQKIAKQEVAEKCDALWDRAYEKAENEDYKGAITDYKRVLELCPNECSAKNNIGAALRGLGKDQEAFNWYQAALACDPSNESYQKRVRNLKKELSSQDVESECDALWDKAHEKADNEDYYGAIKDYKRVVDLCPDFCSAKNNIGSAFDELGKQKEALNWFQAALECNPDKQLYKDNVKSTKAEIANAKTTSPVKSPQPTTPGAYNGTVSGQASGVISFNVSVPYAIGKVSGTYKGKPFSGHFNGRYYDNGNIRSELVGGFSGETFKGTITGTVNGNHASGSWSINNKYASPTGSWEATKN